MTDLSNSTPETDGTATAEMPPVPGTGTVQTSGEANDGQGAPADEGFTHVDPKTLPPQLRSAYDNMLKDYKNKTTSLSETIKQETERAVQAYREKASQYDQISTQEEFVKMWNDYVQKSQSQGQAQEGDPVLNQMKQQLQEMSQKIQVSEMTQVTDAFAEAINEKGEKIHPDFDSLNSISLGKIQNGNNVEDFSLLRACIELSQGKTPQERLANGYKLAKSAHDSIFESGRKAGMGRMERKIQNSSLPPSHSSGDVLNMTDKKPKNAREALEMAKKGLVVSRE